MRGLQESWRFCALCNSVVFSQLQTNPSNTPMQFVSSTCDQSVAPIEGIWLALRGLVLLQSLGSGISQPAVCGYKAVWSCNPNSSTLLFSHIYTATLATPTSAFTRANANGKKTNSQVRLPVSLVLRAFGRHFTRSLTGAAFRARGRTSLVVHSLSSLVHLPRLHTPSSRRLLSADKRILHLSFPLQDLPFIASSVG